MDKHVRVRTFVSIFAGAGGMDLGFIQEGWLPASPAHVVECDEAAVATYNANVGAAVMMGGVVPTDIRGWAPPSLPVPPVAVIGGFPCPSFSRARGKDARSNPISSGMEMVEETARVIAAVRPTVFMLECVQQSRRHALPLLSLRLPDYNITTYDIDFCDYGVPQHRRRMLYVGVRGWGVGVLPPTPAPLPPHEWRTAGDALSSPYLHVGDGAGVAPPIMQFIPPGYNYHTARREGLIPEYILSTIHPYRMETYYKRLLADKPAYTVCASGGGGSYMYHYDEGGRALTNEERAALQSFPPSPLWRWCGGKTAVRRQIGNAVPPEGIRPWARWLAAVADVVVRVGGGEKYEKV